MCMNFKNCIARLTYMVSILCNNIFDFSHQDVKLIDKSMSQSL